uniref:Cuticle-degrading serine protease-like isoform X1 n=1 Tax=Saccoglossus kowalevskii TaxID=10224 RepID=A0ABM0ML76_SACKO|nr:PREDICTED: cuticle-degrading serine protease-like isoform X1 [Saccoglossus kowalevskii]XP_006820766.1 PREDICTED: cuticle-degrading serine protease-like isoform X2 [Saccoglossus kowalevskii]XP_006820767.1 PREDICTED: cuticle-degrading serine protease-like isoform X3 [Saccoglossus kowalevskii]
MYNVFILRFDSQTIILKMRFLIFAVLVATAVATAPYYRVRDAVEGRYLIKLKDGVSISDFASKMAPLGASVVKKYRKVLNGIAISAQPKIITSLRNMDEIEYIEDDGITRATVEWGMDRTDQRSNNLDGRMNLYATGSGANAYILDTGLRHSHNEFDNRASYFWDYDSSNNGEDCNGHGTHCGGTVGGNSVGIAPDTLLYSVRVLNCQGSGLISNMVDGLDEIVAWGDTPSRSVVSMSVGAGASLSLDNAVQRVIDDGYTASIAAGNENQDACNTSPARVEDAITVGATDVNDNRAGFSNWGSCLDIFAPGVAVRSAWYTCDSCYETISGTSMACPHVSGVAAVHLGAGTCNDNASCRNKIVALDSTIGAVNDPNGSPNLLLYCD